MVHKQQILERKENEINGAVTKGSDEIKVMYTNIDGLTRKLELIDYLKEKKPEIVCLAETKLCEEIQTNIENDNYNIWRKEDKKGDGVMLMIKSKIKVKNVEYGKGKAEVISVQIKTRYGESQNIVVAYVPQKQKFGLRKNMKKLYCNKELLQLN